VATDAGQKDEKGVRAMISAVDKAAKRGIIHRNAANRRKARLNRARMSGTPAPTAAAATTAQAAEA